MGPMLRLNEEESERIHDLSLELNKLRIENGVQPLAMSKLLHLAIQVGMDTLEDQPEAVLTVIKITGNYGNRLYLSVFAFSSILR